MNSLAQKVSRVTVGVAAATLLVSSSAFAHVVVKPAEVVTAGFQTFSMGVPNEQEQPTTAVKLVMPEGLKYVSPTQKSGWQIDIEKEGAGEDAVVKSITWSGSTVNAGFRDDFTFSGQVPAKATELQWKAYQTYQDGTVVAWDQAPPKDESDDETVKPFSVTKVVIESAADVAVSNVSKEASDASASATTGIYIGVAGVIVGLVAVYFATRPTHKTKK